MQLQSVELPSNKKFGFFFTFVFLIFSGYFYFKNVSTWDYVFATTAIFIFLVTLVKAKFLTPLNKLWMQLGLVLGMIINPIVLGIIFFGLFTPIALTMKMWGRDELRLKFKKQKTNWISRNEQVKADSFKNQF